MLRLILMAIICSFVLAVFAGDAKAGTYYVTMTTDSGPGTLRQAIIDSNLNPPQGTNTNIIRFEIPGSGVKTISLLSPLPGILYSVELDGTSQQGYGAVPLIEINGENAGPNASGLRIISGDVILKGIAINRFRRHGIYVSSPGRIKRMNNCRIGTNVQGLTDLGNGGDGIYLTGAFSDEDRTSIIGPRFLHYSAQSYFRERNVISGNDGSGIRVANGHSVAIFAAYIGTDANGLHDLGNAQNGVEITGGSGTVGAIKLSDSTAQDGTQMRRNLISGNDRNGVKISDSAHDIWINGNFIGTTAIGHAAIGNSQNGVLVTTFNTEIQLGSNTVHFGLQHDGNLISGNGENGVKITGAGVYVRNNLIGTNASGMDDLGNGEHGILVSGTSNQPSGNNTIGGNGTKNIVSGNKRDGLKIEATAPGNRISGNNIGTNIDASAGLGNGGNGVTMFSADNHLGGTEQVEVYNIITSNGVHGVLLSGGSNNSVSSNYIGMLSGESGVDVGNGGDGIRIINGSSVNRIHNNKIGYNHGTAINIFKALFGAVPTENKVTANRMFHNGGLAIDLGNNGPTPNDPDDADVGPNMLQNYPIVVKANDYVTATLNSLPNTTYRIDLFRRGCNITNFGIQADYLTFFEVTTDSTGQAVYGFPVLPTFPNGLAATATDPEGNTSELSPCAQIPSTVSFSSSELTVNESGSTATITLYRTGNTPVSVNYSTSNGTATAGQDYTTTSGVMTFNVGEFMKSFTIPINNDSIDEEDETVILTLSNPTNGGSIGNPNPTTLTIVDNDPPPSLTVTDFGGPEGLAGGTTSFIFTITLSGSSAKTIDVDYMTTDVTATAGNDYVATSGHLDFQPGETSKTIPVTVIGDGTLEDDETFTLNLSNVVNAVQIDSSGTGTIVNDDKLASISFSTASYSVSEPGTSATITVVRANDLTGTVTVNYGATAGTATVISDFQPVSGTLTFDPGVTALTFEVPVFEDQINETNETVNLALSNATGLSTIGAPSTAVLTIFDDDDTGLPSLTISDVSLLEGDTGTTNAVFTVALSDVSNVDVTVNYATVDATALAGQDYQAVGSVLTIPAGATSAQITVAVTGDLTVEPDETFMLELSAPVNAELNVSQAIVTILNNDSDQSEKIAFTSNRDGDKEILLMNTDGSNEVQLTFNIATDSDPAWSPDRSKIAFVSTRHGHADILIMTNDGTLLASATNDIPVDGDPVWSPDGTKIAFTRFKAPNQSEIYVMNADGSNLTPVAFGPRSESEPSWSPDGKQIAFTRDVGGSTEIFVITLADSTELKLTSNDANDSSPSWSPDGTRIAFVSNRDGQLNIYTMKINGEDVVQLTTEGVNVDPAYASDGLHIWFSSNRSMIENFEIYGMKTDGTAQTPLTNNPAADTKPAR